MAKKERLLISYCILNYQYENRAGRIINPGEPFLYTGGAVAGNTSSGKGFSPNQVTDSSKTPRDCGR
jgi:hypothetical protein